MEELKLKIFNLIDGNFERTEDSLEALRNIDNTLDDIFTSTAYCEQCWGKGYLMDVDSQVKPLGDTETIEPAKPAIEFCECPRGMQLKSLVGKAVIND